MHFFVELAYENVTFDYLVHFILTLLWFGGGQICHLVDFFDQSVKKNFMAMKPLGNFHLPIV